MRKPHLQQCELCRSSSYQFICQDCQNALLYNDTPCASCALPLSAEQALCGDCLQRPKPFSQTLCPLLYHSPLDHLLHSFKHKRPWQLLNVLLPQFLQGMHRRYDQGSLPELLVPVPMHWLNKWQRGFNQAHFFAESLSKACNIPCHNILRKTQSGQAQKSLNKKQRLKNLRHSFALRKSTPVKHVALVDDIVTTSATVTVLSEILLTSGVERVDVWALARTPPPGYLSN